MRDHLELPRPLRLLWTLGWSLIESAGLPLGALALAGWLYGRDAGLLAGLGATWLTALIRKLVCGSVPSLLTISAFVMLSTAITVGLTALGIGVSTLWFRAALRGCGLRLRFAPT